MKAFVIILILAAAGWFAWSKGWIGGGDAPAEGEGTEEGAFEGVDDDGDGSQPATAGGSGLDAEVEQLLAACEDRWAELEASGKPPALAPDMPSLARDYSTVLKATYNRPGLKDVQHQIVNKRLLPAAEKLFFSKYRYADDQSGVFALHKVEQGEKPDSIGREYGMSYQLINIMRERPPEDGDLKLGETLKVINAKEQGGYHIHVDKSDYFADIYICGILARRYDVGIGAIETPTPTGTARIDERQLEPDWTNPTTGEVIPWNDPRNLLGRIWLQLKPDEINQDGIGIHGFNGDPALAVKVKASNGCVRMRNDDAAELYHLMVPVGYYKTEGFLQRAPMTVEIVE